MMVRPTKLYRELLNGRRSQPTALRDDEPVAVAVNAARPCASPPLRRFYGGTLPSHGGRLVTMDGSSHDPATTLRRHVARLSALARGDADTIKHAHLAAALVLSDRRRGRGRCPDGC